MSPKGNALPIKWYRSTIWSAWMVALIAFVGTGMFGGLNGMGAGGGRSPEVSNAANAIVFGLIASCSWFVGGICNRIGPKWTLLIGTMGYAPYAAGLYVVDKYGISWFSLLGAAVLGLLGCFTWTASGAIYMGYTEPHRQGFATALKFTLQNLGASIGAMISLGLNINAAHQGSISNTTYIVFIVIMCLGFPFALCVPTPNQVQRTDGMRVTIKRFPTLVEEFQVLRALLQAPPVIAMIPVMIYAQWFTSYQWQFNYKYFTVRTRALNSLLFYLGGFLISLIMGWALDWQRLSRRTRAKIGFWMLFIFVGTSWILGMVVQNKYSKENPLLDWSQKGYGLGCATFLFWGISDPMVMTFKYWIMASLTGNINELTFLSALINGIGAIGSTMGFVITAKDFSMIGACAINMSLFALCMPCLFWVVYFQAQESSQGKTLTSLVGTQADEILGINPDDNRDGPDLKGDKSKNGPA